MRSSPSGWVKENIRLCDDEMREREFLRVATDSASDSEVLRQALRITQQLVQDLDSGKRLEIHRRNGDVVSVEPSLFVDNPDNPKSLHRRSLILHRSSVERIESLRLRLGLEDISAVARFALRFLFKIFKEDSEGANFFVFGQNDERTQVRFATVSNKPSEEPSPYPPNSKINLPKKPVPALPRASGF
jgi:hypothetical protein